MNKKVGIVIVSHSLDIAKGTADMVRNMVGSAIPLAYCGGNPDGVIAAADRVLMLADDKTKIIPGHGPVSSKADLKAYRDMLATVTGRIKALLKAGKKLEDIKAANPSAEFDEKWGKAFMSPPRFIEMLVGSYS